MIQCEVIGKTKVEHNVHEEPLIPPLTPFNPLPPLFLLALFKTCVQNRAICLSISGILYVCCS